jgi:cell division protein FtsQ
MKMTKTNRRIKKPKKTPRNYAWLNTFFVYCRFVLLTVISVAIVGVVSFYGVQMTQQFLNRPIAQVIIEGDFHYVKKESVNRVVQTMIGDSFVGENIDKIKEQLQSTPWIDTVNLARQWPDRLQVNIAEQVPIARWGDNSFINVRGELVRVGENASLHHLSKLSGNDDDAQMIMQQYAILTNVFQPYGLSVDALEKDRRGVWELRLSNHWLVKLGRDETFQKVQRLTHLFDKQLLEKTANIAVIDIRYSNGLAVQWGKGHEPLEKKIKDDKNSTSANTNLRYLHDIKYARG